MNKSDAKLKECVEDLLEEEVKAIPSDSKIKETHVFSKAFEKDMKRLIQKNKIQKIHRMYKVLGVCAVVVLVIAVGGAQELFFQNEESAQNYMEGITEDAVEESIEETESAEESCTTDSMTEEIVNGEGGHLGIVEDYSEEEKQSWIKSSYSDEINVTDMEEKPIGIKVSVLENDEDGIVLYQQIKNNADKKIRYMEGSYMLEIWNDDGWYVISTSEESKVYILEPDSRYANDIIIPDVRLYDRYQYRLLSMFNGEMKAFMFSVE